MLDDARSSAGSQVDAIIGADVELRELAVEQAGHVAADRMAVIEDDLAVRRRADGPARRTARHDTGPASGRGARRSRLRRAPAGDRAARRRRSSSGRARWWSGPDRARRRRRIAVHVDDAARNVVRTIVASSVGGEGVEPVDPPVGVFPRAPRRDEARERGRREGRCRPCGMPSTSGASPRRTISQSGSAMRHRGNGQRALRRQRAGCPIGRSAAAAAMSGWK
jgi:hypothetical protein